MSTFSAYGMGPKGFLVNRPLNDYEQEHRLDVKQPASTQVHYELSLIKLNSSFVECVDKWYSMRGFMAMAMGTASLIGLYLVLVSTLDLMFQGYWESSITLLLGCGIVWGTGKFFLIDAFTFTHYPIRFNRQNRQVYAFRRDGTVLKAGWDDLYWTIYKATHVGGGDVNVMGHVLDKDGVTVKESIALSEVSIGKEGEDKVKTQFEFFRRYMEDGPGPVLDALKPTPLIMLPGIDKKKESWRFGWERMTLNGNGSLVFMILFQVAYFPISLFRWIVMRTSKIPQWPQWVEDECRIDPNDIWVRDERHAAR